MSPSPHPPARSGGSDSSSGPAWLQPLGRFGYCAKGAVYLLVGGLAVLAALGEGGSVGGSRNAMLELRGGPLGSVMLAAVALGLFAYTAWRLLQAALDPGGDGLDLRGLARRATCAFSGLVHLGLALFAGSVALGLPAAGSADSDGGATWIALVMRQPFGPWLVGAAGLGVVGYGLRQFQRAVQASFMRHYRSRDMSPAHERAARRIGRVGLSARGVVFCIAGLFVVRAAVLAEPSESKGLGGALATLARQPYGPWLLGAAALGLATYGLFCLSYARYRDFRRS